MHALRLSFLALSVLALGVLATSCNPPTPRSSLAGGRLVVQEHFASTIYALDARTGGAVVAMPGDGWVEAGAVRDGVAFLHGHNGLVARDLKTGKVRWRSFVNLGYTWKLTVAKDLVFAQQRFYKGGFTGPETSWVGFDTATGIKRYELLTDRRAPLVANDDVAVTFEQKELVGYNVNDGKERWRSTVEASGPLYVEAGKVYARTGDQLGIFSATTGALQRRVDLGGTDAFDGLRPAFAARGNTFAWVESSVLHVADAATGKEMWRKEGVESLAICAGVVVAGAGGRLFAFDLTTGSQKWKSELAVEDDTLAGADDAVSVRLDSTHVVVVEAATGKQRFVFDAEAGKIDGAVAPSSATSHPSSLPPVKVSPPPVAPADATSR